MLRHPGKDTLETPWSFLGIWTLDRGCTAHSGELQCRPPVRCRKLNGRVDVAKYDLGLQYLIQLSFVAIFLVQGKMAP